MPNMSKNSTFSLDNAANSPTAIAAYIADVAMTRTRETSAVTAINAGVESNVTGQTDGKISFGGPSRARHCFTRRCSGRSCPGA